MDMQDVRDFLEGFDWHDDPVSSPVKVHRPLLYLLNARNSSESISLLTALTTLYNYCITNPNDILRFISFQSDSNDPAKRCFDKELAYRLFHFFRGRDQPLRPDFSTAGGRALEEAYGGDECARVWRFFHLATGMRQPPPGQFTHIEIWVNDYLRNLLKEPFDFGNPGEVTLFDCWDYMQLFGAGARWALYASTLSETKFATFTRPAMADLEFRKIMEARAAWLTGPYMPVHFSETKLAATIFTRPAMAHLESCKITEGHEGRPTQCTLSLWTAKLISQWQGHIIWASSADGFDLAAAQEAHDALLLNEAPFIPLLEYVNAVPNPPVTEDIGDTDHQVPLESSSAQAGAGSALLSQLQASTQQSGQAPSFSTPAITTGLDLPLHSNALMTQPTTPDTCSAVVGVCAPHGVLAAQARSFLSVVSIPADTTELSVHHLVEYLRDVDAPAFRILLQLRHMDYYLASSRCPLPVKTHSWADCTSMLGGFFEHGRLGLYMPGSHSQNTSITRSCVAGQETVDALEIARLVRPDLSNHAPIFWFYLYTDAHNLPPVFPLSSHNEHTGPATLPPSPVPSLPSSLILGHGASNFTLAPPESSSSISPATHAVVGASTAVTTTLMLNAAEQDIENALHHFDMGISDSYSTRELPPPNSLLPSRVPGHQRPLSYWDVVVWACCWVSPQPKTFSTYRTVYT
ncbi:hypothetical protein PENSPDRAFT_672275 [Peniophora sp. CONT]|nr:hypothetical protein PENSPDRAFT_672275 [Peniophora sp. CONT]